MSSIFLLGILSFQHPKGRVTFYSFAISHGGCLQPYSSIFRHNIVKFDIGGGLVLMTSVNLKSWPPPCILCISSGCFLKSPEMNRNQCLLQTHKTSINCN